MRHVTFEDVGGRVTDALVDNAGVLPVAGEPEERLRRVISALVQKDSV